MFMSKSDEKVKLKTQLDKVKRCMVVKLKVQLLS